MYSLVDQRVPDEVQCLSTNGVHISDTVRGCSNSLMALFFRETIWAAY